MPANGPKRLGILLSGRGSNFEAIADNIQSGKLPGAEVGVVISNKAGAAGLERARSRGYAALCVPSQGREREDFDGELAAALKAHAVDLVCLAGFMRLLSPVFLRAFPMQILNIHPSLLPAFPGLDAQGQALAYGVRFTGCTVHFADKELDAGPIVAQATVPVEPNDTAETLSARILREEHRIYSEAIGTVLSGRWHIQGRRVLLDEHL